MCLKNLDYLGSYSKKNLKKIIYSCFTVTSYKFHLVILSPTLKMLILIFNVLFKYKSGINMTFYFL